METVKTKNRVTTEISKTIDVTTKNGLIAKLQLKTSVIHIGKKPLKTKIKYNLIYNGNIVNGYELTEKKQVVYFLDFIDKYSNKL